MSTSKRRGFGSVERLPSGNFRVRYKLDGRWQGAPRTFDTKTDARKFLDTVRADLVRETWQAPRRVSDTVETYARRWIAERPGLKASTRAQYELDLRLHVVPYLGDMRLDQLHADQVRSWYAQLRADLKGKLGTERTQGSHATVRDGTATAARAYRLLRAMYGTAVADGLVPASPCQLKGAGTTKTAERPTLSVREIAALAEALPARYAALAHLLAWSGARIGELAILPIHALDLDSETPSLAVTERVYRISGRYDVDAPKSSAGLRRIALPPHLVPILTEHLQRFPGLDDDGLVFTTTTGASVLGTYSQVFRRALVRIGRPDVRVHDLRHTGMTLAAEAGASLAELKLRMGQSTSRAAELYLHATTDHGRVVAQAMSRLALDSGVTHLAPRRVTRLAQRHRAGKTKLKPR